MNTPTSPGQETNHDVPDHLCSKETPSIICRLYLLPAVTKSKLYQRLLYHGLGRRMLRRQGEGILLVAGVWLLLLLWRRLLPRCCRRHRHLNVLGSGMLPVRRRGLLLR